MSTNQRAVSPSPQRNLNSQKNQEIKPSKPTPLPLKEVQKQVNEVTDILKENVSNLLERDGKLNELAKRAENISESSKMFEKTTHKVQQAYWRQNMKKFIILSVLSIIIVLVISGILYASFR